MQLLERTHGDYTLSTDKTRLQLPVIHGYLSGESYWAKGIPVETVARAIAGSACFGLYCGPDQVGFARVITDEATFAYLCDVFVLPEHRGKGLSKWLMEQVMAHPDVQGLRRWSLATADAHGLYAQFGWKPLAKPERWMEKHDPEVYTRNLGI